MKLSTRPPFSLPAVVRSHGWVGLAPFGMHDDGAELTFVDRLDTGRVVELCIREAASGVSVETSAELSAAEQDEVTGHVTWMLGLDQDFSEFYALAREEPKLAHTETEARGRVLRCPSLFEDTVKTILTTNTSWAGTIRMVDAVVTEFGDPLPADPSRHAFPTPQQLAATDAETLRSEAGLGYRAPYVLELAQAVAGGDLDLEALKTADIPTEDLRKRLLSIKGVGNYAAANLLMLLSRYDFIPVDSWAMKIVSHEWHAGEPVEPADVEARFEHWGEWKGLAFWFWDWAYYQES